MSEFDVGRNVVREAIHSLVSMGLVDVRPGRGAVVTTIDSAHAIGFETFSALLLDAAVDDLNEFRKVIEVEIAGRAATSASESDLKEMRRHLDEFAKRFHNGLSVTEPELAFHHSIAVASGNAIFPQVLDVLKSRLATARTLAAIVDGVTARAMEDHEAIFQAISDHNQALARKAMSRHVDLAVEATSTARQLLAQTRRALASE